MTTSHLTCEQFDALLADRLDGTLDAARQAATDAHLASCVRCRALVADLEDVTAQAAALPELAPSRDLWPAIAERLEAPVVPLHPRAATTVAAPRWPRQLAAAAALVALGVGGTWLAMRRQGPVETAAVPAPVVPALPGSGSVGGSAAQVATIPGQPRTPRPVAVSRPSAEQTYATEVDKLEGALRDRRAQLDPKTVAVIEKNLQIIDAAIREAKAALAKDPKSAFLTDQMTTVLGQKLELLRMAAMLPTRT